MCIRDSTKGSFTGAVTARKGYFELAGEGTIFLDEIGDTSPDFQTKLLRVLQERSFYPVGGEEPKNTHARVIAATHQPVEQLIKEGRFREDLYFRLKVVEIVVPPLRDRSGDISLIANALLGRVREETHREVYRISDAALESLLVHDWPGNIRELENALMRAAIIARGSVIGEDHLVLGDQSLTTDDLTLDLAITRHVQRVIMKCKGDEVAAAELLVITKKKLNSLL